MTVWRRVVKVITFCDFHSTAAILLGLIQRTKIIEVKVRARLSGIYTPWGKTLYIHRLNTAVPGKSNGLKLEQLETGILVIRSQNLVGSKM